MHPIDAASFPVRLGLGLVSGAVTWCVCADLGAAAIRWLVPGWDNYRRLVFGAALGYALLGCAVAILGLSHLLRPAYLLGLVGIAVLARAPVHWQTLPTIPKTLKAGVASFAAWSPLQKSVAAAGAFGLLVAVIAAALPAVWWDPLAYHLPIAAFALDHFTFTFDAEIPESAFPLLGEAAALPAYVLAGSAGAAMATLGSGVTLALVCGIVADSLRKGAGSLAVALVLTSALWLWLSPSFYVDVPFALFCLSALAIAWLPLAGDGEPLRPVAAGLLAGAFAGAAAATKYPGLIVAVLVAVPLLIGSKQRAVRFAAGVTAFCAVALGWYARAWALTGDPVYPFLSVTLAHLRAAPAPAAAHQNVVQWFASATPHFCGRGIGLTDMLLLPVRLLTQPRAFCGDPGPALTAGFVLFLAAPFLVKAARPWFWLTLALTATWFFSAQQWRFLVTALCIVAAALAAAVESLQPRLRTPVVALLVALCFLGAAADVVPALKEAASNSIVPGYAYIAGRESGADYLRHRVDNYAAARWLAQHAPGAKIFALDDVRDYYFGPNVAWGNSPYPGGWRLDWNAPPAKRYRALQQAGYAYMVVNRNAAYINRTIVTVDWPVLDGDEAVGVLQPVFAENDVTVYRLDRSR